MSTLLCRAFSVLSLCVLAGTAAAHGGQYRGGPALPNPGGRMSPGGGLGGPTTPGGASSAPDTTRWQIWWELNKDPYLRRRPGLAMADDGAVAGKPVTAAQKRDIILPALKRALDKTSNRDVTSACLIAIGKIGTDHPDFEILPLLRERLRRGDQEVREAAALALGISERQEAIDDLIALLHDLPNGRRLVDRAHVSDRTRAFAAYGLGLIAAGHDDVDLKARVFEALAQVLDQKREDDRDILVACLNGIRQIDPQPAAGAKNKHLQWGCLDALDRYGSQAATRSRQLVQAHAAPALARLLGRDAGPDTTRFKKLFDETLQGKERSDSTLYQSAALALGEVALPSEHSPEDAPYSETLWQTATKATDKQARYFSTISLGRVGGEANMGRLIMLFQSETGPAQAWAALALGLLAHHEPPGTQERAAARIGPILLEGMDKTSNRDIRGAIAVALGLARYQAAAPELRAMLKKYQKSEFLGGYLCIGLALMDDMEAVPLIEGIIGDAHLRPTLLSQAALALARLQARDAQAALHGLLRSDKRFTLTWASTAAALGHIGDADSVTPLVEMMQRRSTPKLLQAFAAASLGLIADDKEMPWNALIAMGINYQALTETMSNGASGILDIL